MIQALLNPPFNRTFAELGGLTDSQLVYLFDVGERGDGGVPKLRPPATDRPVSLRELFARKCFLLGVTDPDVVERLWAADAAARRARRARAQGGNGP